MITNKDNLRHFAVMAEKTLEEKFGDSVEEVILDLSSHEGRIEAEIKKGIPENGVPKTYDIEEYELQIKEQELPADLKTETQFKETPKEYSNARGLGLVKTLFGGGTMFIAGSAIYLWLLYSAHAPIPSRFTTAMMILAITAVLQVLGYIMVSGKIKKIKEKEAEVEK